MMRMTFWFGYDLGEFMFPGLDITTLWAFALTWILLFVIALFYEASKVYLAKIQYCALSKIRHHTSIERRNLLSEREQGNAEPSTSRKTNSAHISRNKFRWRVLLHAHQSVMFMIHNVVGYLLMLAVMVFNVQLLLAVVLGMMVGYFIWGPKLARLQMQCCTTKRETGCTPECDDTAENTAPPLLDSSMSSESDFFICQTRTCVQPSHYMPSTSQDGSTNEQTATCFYGAKNCPSKVARMKKMQASTSHCQHENEKDDSPSVEDVQLLRTERQGCCKKKQEPPPEEKCCKKETVVIVHEATPVDNQSCCKEEDQSRQETRERSPPITCCHNTKTSDSQEQIIK